MSQLLLRHHDSWNASEYRCNFEPVLNESSLVVDLDPPLRLDPLAAKELYSTVKLTPRFRGDALVPNLSAEPVIVNVTVPAEGGTGDSGPWRLLIIGELYASKSET